MRALTWASLGLLVAVTSCGSGKSNHDTGDDAGTGADGGTASFTYSPAGCAYTVTPPATRGYTDMAADDTSAFDDASKATPMRVRVGLGGGTTSGQAGYADPTTTAAFTWETAAPDHAAKVKMGTDPGTLSDVHAGYSWTTPPPTIGFSSGVPEYMHEVHVCGLQPATTYYYQVGGGPTGSEVWSATQSFTTVPDSGSITVGVLGDARDKVSTWQLVQRRMLDAGAAMQLVGGDVVDIGSLSNLYDQWLDAIWQDPDASGKFITLGQQMMVPIAGNHENEASQFYANFAIPGDDPDYAEQYASFDVGNTHFVLVDDQPVSQEGSTGGAAILSWLDGDLSRADANRAKVPFIVVISHRGLYSTSNHSTDGDVLYARSQLAPVFDKYKVDVVINGHDHEYERSKPLQAGSPPSGDPVVGKGTVYVICAGAGADPYAVGTTASTFREKNAAFGNGTSYIGTYALLTLSGNQLTLNAYGLKASGTKVADDDVLDTVQLTH